MPVLSKLKLFLIVLKLIKYLKFIQELFFYYRVRDKIKRYQVFLSDSYTSFIATELYFEFKIKIQW